VGVGEFETRGGWWVWVVGCFAYCGCGYVPVAIPSRHLVDPASSPPVRRCRQSHPLLRRPRPPQPTPTVVAPPDAVATVRSDQEPAPPLSAAATTPHHQRRQRTPTLVTSSAVAATAVTHARRSFHRRRYHHHSGFVGFLPLEFLMVSCPSQFHVRSSSIPNPVDSWSVQRWVVKGSSWFHSHKWHLHVWTCQMFLHSSSACFLLVANNFALIFKSR
jgi:hypothetical protein